jgi:hypothetical protein
VTKAGRSDISDAAVSISARCSLGTLPVFVLVGNDNTLAFTKCKMSESMLANNDCSVFPFAHPFERKEAAKTV